MLLNFCFIKNLLLFDSFIYFPLDNRHHSASNNIMSSTGDCSVESCAVELSLYGYRPNLGANIFLTVIYSLVISTAAIIILQRRRGWLSYNICIILGSILELVGYAERIKGYSNPFALDGFTIQYALLTIAPVFITAA